MINMVEARISIAEAVQLELESDIVFLYDDDFLCHVSVNTKELRRWVEEDQKVLNLIFNGRFLLNVGSLTLSVLLFFPRISYADSGKQKQSPSQVIQVESKEKKGKIGSVMDYRPQSLLDQLKSESNSDSFLKIRRVQVGPKAPQNIYEISEEKSILPEIPEIVRYKTLPIRIKSPKNFAASSLTTPQSFSASYDSSFSNLVPEWVDISSGKISSFQRIKDVQTVRSIIHLRGGFQILSLGVLISKLVTYIQERVEIQNQNLSEIERVKTSRQEKVRLFCLGLISFLVLLAAILFIFARKSSVNASSVDAQIILRMQEKLEEISKQQEKLKVEIVDLTQMLLQFGEMTRGFEETTSSVVKTLFKKVEDVSEGGDKEPGGVSVRSFKRLWVNQCKKVVLSFVLSNQIPEILALFSEMEDVEEIAAFIENVCKGDLG